MDVVGHDAPAENAHARVLAVVVEEVQVGVATCLGEKDIGAIDASLGDVVGDFGKNASWISRHESMKSGEKRVSLILHIFTSPKWRQSDLSPFRCFACSLAGDLARAIVVRIAVPFGR